MLQDEKFSPRTILLLASAEGAETKTHHANVDLRRAELIREIQALDRSRNSVLPICRLPIEILSRIFLLVNIATSGTWIAQTTHVCGHWRTVALSFTNLWTNPDFSNPPIARLMLQRAKTSVLDLKFEDAWYAPSVKEDAVKTFCEALSQPAGLRSVKISVQEEKLWQCLRSTLSDWDTPAIHLEELTIVCLMPSAPTGSPTSKPSIPTSAPSLRRLTLINCTIPLDTLQWSRKITHLFLKENSREPGVKFTSMRVLLRALREMPLLEDLGLLLCLPNNISRDIILSTPLSMPCLARLEVCDRPADKISLLLGAIQCPELASVAMSTSLHEGLPHAFVALHRMIVDSSPHKSNPNFTDAEKLRVSLRRGTGSATCYLWFGSAPVTSSLIRPVEYDSESALKFTIDVDATYPAVQHLRKVNEIFDLSSVRTVEFYYAINGAEEFWEFISRLPHVETITLFFTESPSAVTSFISAWTRSTPTAGGVIAQDSDTSVEGELEEISQDPFPALSTLNLQHVEIFAVSSLISALKTRPGVLSALVLDLCKGLVARDYERMVRELPGVKVSWIDINDDTQVISTNS